MYHLNNENNMEGREEMMHMVITKMKEIT